MRVLSGVLCIICILSFAAWGGIRAVDYVLYERNIGGYLKRAADANTVALAKENLGFALKNIKAEGMTDGYTSVLWRTPDEDVGFWYQNLSASHKELDEVRPDATQLERSNVLIKLRETLLDHGKDSVKVTAPEAVYIYPHNTLFFWWGWLSCIFTAVFGFVFFSGIDERLHYRRYGC